MYHLNKLREGALGLMRSRFKDVVHGPEFKQLSTEDLIEYISGMNTILVWGLFLVCLVFGVMLFFLPLIMWGLAHSKIQDTFIVSPEWLFFLVYFFPTEAS